MLRVLSSKVQSVSRCISQNTVLLNQCKGCQSVAVSNFSSSIPFFSNANDTGFTGHIPIDDLKFTYSRSSGSGGQHVNKVNTKVEIRFHVDSANFIPGDLKEKFKDQQRGRMTKDGHIIVTSEKTRVQMLNKADALDKLRDMVFKAAQKPSEPSEEDIKIKQKRHEKMVKDMLRQKKIHSLKKQSRQGPSIHSL